MPEDDKPKVHRLGDVRPDWLTSGARKPEPENPPDVEVEAPWEEPAKPPSKLSRIWSLSWVTALTLVAFAAIFAIARHFKDTTQTLESKATPLSLTEEEQRAAVEERIHAFALAESNDERLKHILNAEQLRESVVGYYTKNPIDFPAPVAVESLNFVVINGHSWCWVAFSPIGEPRRFAALKQAGGRYLIDWESLVAYGEMSWAEFCGTRPTESIQMRVYIAYTSYYNHKYEDRNKYVAFRIEHQDGSPWLYGYVERGGAVHYILAQSVQPGTRQPVNIRLRFEQDAGADNLAVIDELIHSLWTAPDLTD